MRNFLKIPQKVHHGLMLVADLAVKFDENQPVSLEKIARKRRLSQGFLEEIAADLRAAGIIVGRRGARGGYLLTKNPETLTVADVICAMEGPIALVDCLAQDKTCRLADACASYGVWSRVQRTLLGALAGMTVMDMIAEPNRGVAEPHEHE